MAGIQTERVTKRYGNVTAVRALRVIPAASMSSAEGTVPGKVVELTFLGNIVDCHVTLDDGTRVRVQAEPGLTLEVGQPVGVRFDSRASSVFPA